MSAALIRLLNDLLTLFLTLLLSNIRHQMRQHLGLLPPVLVILPGRQTRNPGVKVLLHFHLRTLPVTEHLILQQHSYARRAQVHPSFADHALVDVAVVPACVLHMRLHLALRVLDLEIAHVVEGICSPDAPSDFARLALLQRLSVPLILVLHQQQIRLRCELLRTDGSARQEVLFRASGGIVGFCPQQFILGSLAQEAFPHVFPVLFPLSRLILLVDY